MYFTGRVVRTLLKELCVLYWKSCAYSAERIVYIYFTGRVVRTLLKELYVLFWQSCAYSAKRVVYTLLEEL